MSNTPSPDAENTDRALRQRTEQIKLLEDKIDQLNRMQEDFITVISHELKTPMTSIIGYIWMILNGKAGEIDEKTQRYLENAYNSARRQVKIIDDMLTISRLERNVLKLNKESQNLLEVIHELLDEVHAQAENKSLTVTLETPSDPLPDVCADHNYLRQIIRNLLDNAISYTDEGGITISFNLRNGFVETAIADTGGGISQDDMDKIFTKFNKVGSSFEDMAQSSGVGTGLYLTKALVERHGGTIWVGTEEGNGSTFTFSIPVAE